MDPVDQSVVRYVWAELRRVQQGGTPYGVWLRRHAPVRGLFCKTGMDEIQTPLLHAWFITSEGVSRDDTCSFQRYQVINIDQPWCSKISREKQPAIGKVHHSIALAAFAQYEGTNEFYLETIWGGTSGRGTRVQVVEGRVALGQTLWIS